MSTDDITWAAYKETDALVRAMYNTVLASIEATRKAAMTAAWAACEAEQVTARVTYKAALE